MDVKKFIELSKVAQKLKRVKRTGWVLENIPLPESVADHSFGTAFMAMILAKELNLDQLKVMKMALIHDLAEAIVGDIVTVNGKEILDNYAEKIALEMKTMGDISNITGDQEIVELFTELEENTTAEARLVKQIDKVEMALQTLEYEKQENKDLTAFFESVEVRVHAPLIKDIFDQIVEEREFNAS